MMRRPSLSMNTIDSKNYEWVTFRFFLPILFSASTAWNDLNRKSTVCYSVWQTELISFSHFSQWQGRQRINPAYWSHHACHHTYMNTEATVYLFSSTHLHTDYNCSLSCCTALFIKMALAWVWVAVCLIRNSESLHGSVKVFSNTPGRGRVCQ